MLTFDESRHEYRWHNRIVPSVTQTLAALNNFDDVPPAILERKRQIGTAVHAAIHLEMLGHLDHDSVDPQAQGYFDAWRRFRDENRFEPVLIEHRVTSDELGERYRYAGTLDEWGLLGAYPALIDWKTSLQVNTHAVGSQLAGYLKALVRMNSVGAALSDRRFALKLSSDGKYKLVRFSALDDDWQRFVLQLRANLMRGEAA